MDSWFTSSVFVASIAFIGMFGGALIAMSLARCLPSHHLSSASQDSVKLGVGMIAAMASLILGLMTASVQGNFSQTDRDVHSYALNILTADSDLRHYGPAACPAQKQLGAYVRAVLHEMWSDEPNLPPLAGPARSGEILAKTDALVRQWTPDGDMQKAQRDNILSDLRTVLTSRWTVEQEANAIIPPLFILVLLVWLTLIFVSFGLFAPRNGVVVASLFVCALSIGGALFIILEMSGAFTGLISIHPRPFLEALHTIDAHVCGS